MVRDAAAVETEYKGQRYRSRTEARWAVFFSELQLGFQYEPERLQLSSGDSYLPDFYVEAFRAYFEVKPANDAVVTAECTRARQLAADKNGGRVWLAMGPPSPGTGNILPLNQWPLATTIEQILSTIENRYYFLEDRRDDQFYWLQSDIVAGESFKHSFPVGGNGVSTDHDRLPILTPRLEAAYRVAMNAF